LRRQKLQANRLTVFLMTSPFAEGQHSIPIRWRRSCSFRLTTRPISLRRPPLSSRRFTAQAIPTRNAYHAAGFSLGWKSPPRLVRCPRSTKRVRLTKAIDAINYNYGGTHYPFHFSHLGGVGPQWATASRLP